MLTRMYPFKYFLHTRRCMHIFLTNILHILFCIFPIVLLGPLCICFQDLDPPLNLDKEMRSCIIWICWNAPWICGPKNLCEEGQFCGTWLLATALSFKFCNWPPFWEELQHSEGTIHQYFRGENTQAREMKWHGQGATENAMPWFPSTSLKSRSLFPTRSLAHLVSQAPQRLLWEKSSSGKGWGSASTWREAGGHSSSSSFGLFL